MPASGVANVWLERGVFHWAHQGGAKEAPSNTLDAMDRAAAVGADGLEFDVHLSRDGRVVLIHDRALERTTNGQGPVSERSAEELAEWAEPLAEVSAQADAAYVLYNNTRWSRGPGAETIAQAPANARTLRQLLAGRGIPTA